MLRRIDLQIPDHLEEQLLGLAERHGMQFFSSPCIVDTGEGEEDYRFTGETVASFLFSTVEQNAAALEAAINQWQQSENPGGAPPILRDYADDEDWMRTFRTYFQPIQVGNRIVVRPPWSNPLPDESEGVTILIDPGMAFGTGTHETTRLCLLLMEGLPIKGQYLLDIGSGSGILAFALLKWGAQLVEAVEIDGPAVENLKKNALLNGFKPDARLLVSCRDLASFRPSQRLADGLTANITSPVLLEHLELLAGFLKPKAWGVFSGINSTNAPKLRQALNQGSWKLQKESVENGWHGFLASKRCGRE